MNGNVSTTTAKTPILKALALMMRRRVRQLPVITRKKEVIGVITKGDIFKSLFKKYLSLPEIISSKKKEIDLKEFREKVKQVLSTPLYLKNAKIYSKRLKTYGGAQSAEIIENFAKKFT